MARENFSGFLVHFFKHITIDYLRGIYFIIMYYQQPTLSYHFDVKLTVYLKLFASVYSQKMAATWRSLGQVKPTPSCCCSRSRIILPPTSGTAEPLPAAAPCRRTQVSKFFTPVGSPGYTVANPGQGDINFSVEKNN